MLKKIEAALETIRQGKMIILVDDEGRENEGDLVIAAEKVTPEAINFMARFGRGLICLSLTPERCDQLDLRAMVDDNTSKFTTAFTVSIEAKKGVTTGISAHDRATTVLTAIADETKPSDLARPGHIFPLRAKEGGSVGSHRSNRRIRGYRKNGRTQACSRHLRNHERRRNHGSHEGSGSFLQRTQHPNRCDRRFDRIPFAKRKSGEGSRHQQIAQRIRTRIQTSYVREHD
jgi:hypothetical protein